MKPQRLSPSHDYVPTEAQDQIFSQVSDDAISQVNITMSDLVWSQVAAQLRITVRNCLLYEDTSAYLSPRKQNHANA